MSHLLITQDHIERGALYTLVANAFGSYIDRYESDIWKVTFFMLQLLFLIVAGQYFWKAFRIVNEEDKKENE